jgi:hypothetical protein
MIPFNWLGLFFLIIGMAIGYGVEAAVGPVAESNGLAVTIQAVVMALLDVRYRWKADEPGDLWRFLKPMTGGHFIFLPVWAWAAPCLVYGILQMTLQDAG